MTVQKDVTKNIYVGNGSTRTFPFTFECPAEHPEYIKVYLMQDDGTALATSDYQLDMDARQITYPSSGTALPEGKKLVIMRELPLQQMMNLVNNGPYFAEDVELAFDENVMAMQQIAEKLNRSIIMSVDIDGDAFVNEVPFEPGKSFRIADDGKSIVLTEDPARVLPLAENTYAQAKAQAQSAYASAVAAAKSEDSAAASASEAGNSAQAASTSATSAAESARLAEGYKNVAETAKSDAGLYANNAKTSADNATASKEAAQSAANSASNFATDARSSANEAKSYRDAASTYATNAKNYSENVNVFVPSVSAEGVLSWSNKAGLTNPPSVNIKGKDGADGGVTVDTELSSTSTNPVQNKVIYSALEDKMNTKDILSGFALLGGATNIRWREGTQFIGSINAVNYSGTARAATHDGAGNIISETYAKKTDISGGGSITVDTELSSTSTNPVQNKVIYSALDNKLGKNSFAYGALRDAEGNFITSTYVRSVNGVKPDIGGNVTINVSGGGSSITVDAELSETSINPVQNKVIKGALDDKANLNKNNTFSKDNYFQKGISLIAYRDLDSAIKWYQSTANPPVASIDATNYTGNAASATKATQDSEGNVITETYAKKVDVSDVVKSVNGVQPDTSGNVNITVSGGGGSNVTVDTTLSATSTNAIANKTVYNALSGKLDKTAPVYEATKATQDGYGNVITSTYARKVDLASYVKTVNNTAPDENGNVNIAVSGGTNITVDDVLSSTSTNAIQNKAVYAALSNKLGKSDVAVSAQRALQDGDGNTISSTYIKFINGNPPDTSGNVNVSAGGGGGVSTSVANNWTAQQNFQRLKFSFESFATSRISGTYDSPATSVAVYNVTGALVLDMSTLTGMLTNNESTLFTAYIASNASYSLSITNAGTLKYVGSASDLSITNSGLLLNVLLTKNASGAVTTIAQASKLS